MQDHAIVASEQALLESLLGVSDTDLNRAYSESVRLDEEQLMQWMHSGYSLQDESGYSLQDEYLDHVYFSAGMVAANDGRQQIQRRDIRRARQHLRTVRQSSGP